MKTNTLQVKYHTTTYCKKYLIFCCSVLIREDPGTEPDHTVGLKLFALELRLDYMGTGVLMSRVSSLDVSLRDEWKMTSRKASLDAFNPTRRYDLIFFKIVCNRPNQYHFVLLSVYICDAEN